MQLQQLDELLLHLQNVSVGLRLRGHDPVTLPWRHLVDQADGLLTVLPRHVESPASYCAQRIGHRETRVLLDGLVEQRTGALAFDVFDVVERLLIQHQRVGGCRGDRQLLLLRHRRRRRQRDDRTNH